MPFNHDHLFSYGTQILLIVGYAFAASDLFSNPEDASLYFTSSLENVLPDDDSFADSSWFSSFDGIALPGEESSTDLDDFSSLGDIIIASLSFPSDNHDLEIYSDLFEKEKHFEDSSDGLWNDQISTIVPGEVSSTDWDHLSSFGNIIIAPLSSSSDTQDIDFDPKIFENEKVFEDSSHDLWNDEISSSCIDNSLTQPNKLRVRQDSCPISPSNPLTVPEIPDLDDIEDAFAARVIPDSPKPPYTMAVRVGDRSITSDQPEFYCNYGGYELDIQNYKIPVCGPAIPRKNAPVFRLYAIVKPARLRKSIYECNSLRKMCH
jgi:hypothetical protein